MSMPLQLNRDDLPILGQSLENGRPAESTVEYHEWFARALNLVVHLEAVHVSVAVLHFDRSFNLRFVRLAVRYDS